jgi:CubicO group peptidase (beta-lactamase class C family)
VRRGARFGAAVLVILTAVLLLDRTFWYRFATIRDQTPASYPGWIAPRATVPGDFQAPLPVVEPDSSLLSPAAVAALEAYADDAGSFSLLVHHAGRIQLETYWRGFGPEEVSETYSMAKSVTALMTGFAVEDGFIASIDDPVAVYLPEWSASPRGEITIRQLLQMASGLEHFRFNYRWLQNPYSKALRLFIGPNMEKALLRFELASAPGSEFFYNSANTQLLMLILSRVIDQPYAEYVSARLWKPLGAKAATLWLDRAGGLPEAYSFFQARPRDWLRLGLALKNDGVVDGTQVIPRQWISQMKTPSPANPKYGFQLWLGSPHTPKRFYNRNTPFGVPQAEPFLAEDVVFFDGGGGQRVYVIPSADVVIVRTGMPAVKWDDGVVPNIVLADLQGQGS